MLSITDPRRTLTLAIAGSFLFVACTTASTVTPGSDTAAAPASAGAPTNGAAVATDAPPEATDWRDIELTDAVTGEAFTLASLEGEIVAVEPFAVWCTNCHIQQDNVKAAYDDLEAAGVRFISIGVEPNESEDRIANYRERRGYPWTFVQSPTEFSRALNDVFGPQILAVPATPLIVLDAAGEVVSQHVGFHGPDKLREIFAEAAAGA